MTSSFFRSMYNETIYLLDSVIMISRIIKVLVRVINLDHPLPSADNPYLDLDYSGYHKNLIQNGVILFINV